MSVGKCHQVSERGLIRILSALTKEPSQNVPGPLWTKIIITEKSITVSEDSKWQPPHRHPN